MAALKGTLDVLISKNQHYKITSAGRKQLERELSRYSRVSEAIARVLQPA